MLRQAGARVEVAAPDHSISALEDVLADADAWIAGSGPIRAEHLARAPQLKVIARYGTGTEAVDLEAATANGVIVTNTPDANADAVAEFTVALMLGALRGIPRLDRQVRSGSWAVEHSRELSGLTIGIVGLGRIGQRVVALLAGFHPNVIAHDPWVDPARAADLGVDLVELDEIGRRSDIVTLHAAGSTPIIDADWLKSARAGLILVNAARGGLVDESAVASALRDEHLSHYATDTLSVENGAGGTPSPLLDPSLADRTTITPHSGAQTIEAVDRMGRGSVEAVIAVLRGGQPAHVVNPKAYREARAV
jgi:D-3-phosphoglycerate dehydrogenase